MADFTGENSGLTIAEDGLAWEYISSEESEFLYDEIFVKEVYMQHGIQLQDGAIVIDVGANIGLFSLYCVRHLKSLSLICIEPLPPNFNALRRNLADYARKSNEKYAIKFIECAVGNILETNTGSDFSFYPDNPGESTRYPKERLNQRNILLDAAQQSDIEEIRGMGCETTLEGEGNKEDRYVYNCQIKSIESILTEQNIQSVDLIKVSQIVHIITSFLSVLIGMRS